MPYRSKKQRAFMHIHHPRIAARWDRETGGKIVKSLKSLAGRNSDIAQQVTHIPTRAVQVLGPLASIGNSTAR